MRKKGHKYHRLARKMSNEELRDALWEVRDKIKTSTTQDNSLDQLLRLEEIYSLELKNRALLEWALKSKN